MRHILGQLAHCIPPDNPARRIGKCAAEMKEQKRQHEELPADEPEREPFGEPAAYPVARRVDSWEAQYVSRGPLKHGHALRILGEDREEGDRGGAGADDDDTLAGVIEVRGPELRVHGCAFEILEAGDSGREGLVVVVVAGREDDEARAQGRAAPGVVHLKEPGLRVAAPVRGQDLVREADALVNAEGGGGVADVGQDASAVGDGALFGPGPPGEAEGMQVAVGADARVLEEVPGPAYGLPGLEDGVGLVRALGLDAVGGVYAGDAGADYEDVISGWG